MTTSGTSSFTATRDQIIRASLRKIGAIASNETPSASMVQDCAFALNSMVKRWDTKGIHLWTESEAILFLVPGQNQYSLGVGSTSNSSQTNPPNYIQTSLLAAIPFAASSIQVNSTQGMVSGDQIGITLDDGTIFWTSIVGTPGTFTVNLLAPTPDSSAAGNYVFDYTTPLTTRPLRIPFARRYNILSAIDTPMINMSRMDYRNLPNKTSTGLPTQYFYDPQLVLGQLYIWPVPIDTSNAIKFTWYRPIQDFDNAANTPDLPQEWIDALVFNLAVTMGPEFDCPAQRMGEIKSQALMYLDDVMGWDREPESTYWGVNFDQR